MHRVWSYGRSQTALQKPTFSCKEGNSLWILCSIFRLGWGHLTKDSTWLLFHPGTQSLVLGENRDSHWTSSSSSASRGPGELTNHLRFFTGSSDLWSPHHELQSPELTHSYKEIPSSTSSPAKQTALFHQISLYCSHVYLCNIKMTDEDTNFGEDRHTHLDTRWHVFSAMPKV